MGSTALALAHRSRGSLNAATGRVHSFREIAELVVAQLGAEVPVEGSPRSGPMPHGGYRPFDPSAAAAAFPDFRFTPLEQGLERVHQQVQEHSRVHPAAVTNKPAGGSCEFGEVALQVIQTETKE